MQVFIGVGSNIGNREAHLKTAQSMLASSRGIRFLRASRTRETDPVGGPEQGKYLNAVWEIDTDLSAHELLAVCQDIEKQMGRTPGGRNEPRIIDLDILFYGNLVVEGAWLRIPHPRLHERTFVMEPMRELAPDWVHPRSNLTMKEILESLGETV